MANETIGVSIADLEQSIAAMRAALDEARRNTDSPDLIVLPPEFYALVDTYRTHAELQGAYHKAGGDAIMWIVGRRGVPWEIIGVFDSQEQATSNCLDSTYFFAPLPLNEANHNPPEEWPWLRYPIGGVNGKRDDRT